MTRTMAEVRADTGSYRDPSGRVFVLGDRVLRTVMPRAAADFEFVRSTGVLEKLIAEGAAIAEQRVDPSGLPGGFEAARYVVQHPKLPFVSYPYEWCFSGLKRAALLHLDIQIRCLEQDVTLSDASAYNIQFLGTEANLHRQSILPALSRGRVLDRPQAVLRAVPEPAFTASPARGAAQRVVSWRS